MVGALKLSLPLATSFTKSPRVDFDVSICERVEEKSGKKEGRKEGRKEDEKREEKRAEFFLGNNRKWGTEMRKKEVKGNKKKKGLGSGDFDVVLRCCSRFVPLICRDS
jgi:hypothetical protein